MSFEKDFTPPCQKMLSLAPYFNDNPISKHYADGNTAFAAGQAGMYMQGPWAVGEILAINPKLKMGTFPLPATDDASQTKCRVNLDLAIWLPRSQAPAQRAAAIKFLDYLMQPSIMNAYNQANLAFSPLKNAPPQTSPLVSGLQQYVSSGRFYQGAGTVRAAHDPDRELHPGNDADRQRQRIHLVDGRRFQAPGHPDLGVNPHEHRI